MSMHPIAKPNGCTAILPLKGVLPVDGYDVCLKLTALSEAKLAFCSVHMRSLTSLRPPARADCERSAEAHRGILCNGKEILGHREEERPLLRRRKEPTTGREVWLRALSAPGPSRLADGCIESTTIRLHDQSAASIPIAKTGCSQIWRLRRTFAVVATLERDRPRLNRLRILKSGSDSRCWPLEASTPWDEPIRLICSSGWFALAAPESCRAVAAPCQCGHCGEVTPALMRTAAVRPIGGHRP